MIYFLSYFALPTYTVYMFTSCLVSVGGDNGQDIDDMIYGDAETKPSEGAGAT